MSPIERSLVVSLHDVSPLTFERCARAVEALEGAGIARISLLVIPNHHHRGHVSESGPLCEWLRACARRGHEIVTHGYFHKRARRAKEGLVQRMTTRVYTAGEGEFYDMGRDEAAALVRKANGELRALGLKPRGFIAPAWLLSAEAEAALRDVGCEYTTRLREVLDLQCGVVTESQSLCWSVRAAWRRTVSIVWNAALFPRLKGAALMRLAVHPVDIDHPAVWHQVLSLCRAALETRKPVTYFEWIARERSSLPVLS